jgi:hypothetical protein
MNYILLRDNKKNIENTAIVNEEEAGFASELLQDNASFLTESVRREIQKLSVLEIIA